MNTQRAYNKRMENQNRLGNKAQRRKRYKSIIKELGVRNISLENIANGEKLQGFAEALDLTNSTLDEALVLAQYGKAITQGDTKAAEFIRDTVGEKPSTQVDLNQSSNGLADMTTDELIALKAEIETYNKGLMNETTTTT